MPLVDIPVIEQKAEMIAKVTEAMVSVEGEKLRGLTWVKLNEVEGRNWAIGVQALTGADVQKVCSGVAHTLHASPAFEGTVLPGSIRTF